MKKFDVKVIVLAVALAIVLFISLFALSSCGNMNMMDTTYSFERVVMSLPNGDVIEGKVTNWVDWEDSDMVQVKIDGKTYLTHSSNVVLISE